MAIVYTGDCSKSASFFSLRRTFSGPCSSPLFHKGGTVQGKGGVGHNTREALFRVLFLPENPRHSLETPTIVISRRMYYHVPFWKWTRVSIFPLEQSASSKIWLNLGGMSFARPLIHIWELAFILSVPRDLLVSFFLCSSIALS